MRVAREQLELVRCLPPYDRIRFAVNRPEWTFGTPRQDRGVGMNTGGASFPRYSTSFVGREREATELVNQVANNRFVGLIGPGGVGKTRLAAHAAPGLRQLFDEGLTTVDVVGTVTPAEFRARVADAIGLRDADVASLEALTEALRGRRALLVLDGCELFDSESRMTVQQLLDSSDTLSILRDK